LVGKGEAWLADFTLTLKKLLPSLIITHSPLSSFFSTSSSFPKGGYLQVHKLAGSAISFYNVLFFNQSPSNNYNTPNSLFNKSNGAYAQSSVNEIIANGIPSNKIVVGKPATLNSADSQSYIDPNTLGQAFLDEYNYNKWYTGIMLWEHTSDPNGTIIQQIMAPFRSKYSSLFK
jgi:chitinase